MISPDWLEVFCCPETHQALSLADPGLIEQLNQAIVAGHLRNRAGKILQEKLDGGLVRADQKYLYPIREAIPILLIDEAVPLEAPPMSR